MNKADMLPQDSLLGIVKYSRVIINEYDFDELEASNSLQFSENREA